ncbi:Hypothetical predicted protein, partial [Paramuricea clavata]
NLAENWRRFKQQFEIYLIASGLDKKDGKVQAIALLHVAGYEALEVYNTFQWDTAGDDVKVDKIMEKFERYCNPRKNLTFDRHSFFTRNQQEGETIDTYVTELRKKASRCEFADLKDGLIRDRIVCGIINDSLKELTNEKSVHAVRVEDKAGQSDTWKGKREEKRDKTGNNICNYCGYRHRRGRCPAYGKNCTRCKKLHHFASMCKAKEINFIDKTDEEQDQHFFIGTVKSDEAKQDDWCVNLKVNEHTTSFKIDTGAQCNVVPVNLCRKVGIEYNHKTGAKLISYSGHDIKAVGKATIAVECKNKYYLLDVQVINSDVIPVLGLPSSNELNLIQRVHNIESSNDQTTEEILEKYEYLFEGIGTLPGEYEIKIEEPVSPAIYPPRRIPHLLKDKIKDELNRMEARGIITKVEQPTKWVNPMVVVKKPNRDLTEESTWFTTFNTPFGRYNARGFPKKPAPKVFQRNLAQTFEDIEGCEVIVDDLLVWGKDETEHNERLKKVIERAAEVDLRFNKEKCRFNKKEVRYVGHIFGSDGLKRNPDRVQAIIDMPVPQDRKSLQRFLGMVNYLNKFIPNLADISRPLRELMEYSVAWHWMEKQQEAYDILISLIAQAPVLKYFDLDSDITISVDASSEGLGACLLQGNQPVAYASRALNRAERNYAQIEKEMLTIVFGATKFHQYIYGNTVTVETDHKPLESLFKKALCKAQQRIQRMMLKVQQYDLKVKYIPGETLYIADTLSRASQTSMSECMDKEEFEVHLLVPISQEKAEEFKRELDRDPIMAKLKETVLLGCPDKISEVDPDVQEYWNFRDELCICDGHLFKR